jgi:hypothetical protein
MARLPGRAAQLLVDRFRIIGEPETGLDFTFLGAECLRFTRPACAPKVLGIAPETDRGRSCRVVLVWLHRFSNG